MRCLLPSPVQFLPRVSTKSIRLASMILPDSNSIQRFLIRFPPPHPPVATATRTALLANHVCAGGGGMWMVQLLYLLQGRINWRTCQSGWSVRNYICLNSSTHNLPDVCCFSECFAFLKLLLDAWVMTVQLQVAVSPTLSGPISSSCVHQKHSTS